MAALPWFAFDREAYISNTMHLTTEEHGAYLLLMLTYYGIGKPLPGYERALASIAKLSLERWYIVEVALKPFFVVDTTEQGSIWRHERIEAELLAASSKHAAAVAKSKAANEARYGKQTTGNAPSIPQAAPKPPRSKKTASSNPASSSEHPPSKPEASSNDPHLQEHITLSVERVIAPEAPKHDDDPKALDEIGREEPLNPLGTTLPETWTPDVACQATAAAYGMLPVDIEAEVLTFHAYNAQNGTFSKNWSATWQMWCARWKERKPKLPLPRVEVDHTPSDADWNRACVRWAKDGSTWSYKSLGPEPGQARCRCPTAILAKHNINPETGRVATPSKEPVS